MSARISYAVHYALKAVLSGSTLSAAAREYGCHLTSLRRALRRHEKKTQAAAANNTRGDCA